MVPSAAALTNNPSIGPALLGQGPSLCLLTVARTSSVFLQLPLWHCAHRMFASQTEGELKVTQVLKEKFPRATAIQVTDISGKAFSHSRRGGFAAVF